MVKFKKVRYTVDHIENESTSEALENAEFFTHNIFNITPINSYIDTGSVSYKFSIGNVIETFTNISTLLKRLIKIYPISLDFVNNVPNFLNNCSNLEECISDIYNKATEEKKITIILHEKMWDILKRVGYGSYEARILVNKYIIRKVEDEVTHSLERHSIKSKIRDWVNEINTITDTKMRLAMEEEYIRGIVYMLIIDYLFSTYLMSNIRDYRNIIYALSRDMFYEAKMNDVLGIMEMNKAKLGVFGWIAMQVIEEDVEGNQVRRFTHRLNYLDLENLFHKTTFKASVYNILQNILLCSETEFSAACENFNGNYGLTHISHNLTDDSGKFKPIEAGGIDGLKVQFEVNDDALRTLNYKKLVNKITQLEEDIEFIKDIDEKERALNNAKFIMEEIYNCGQMTKDNYPELEALQNKMHKIISDIHQKEYDAGFGEGMLQDAKKIVMKIPTAIVDTLAALKESRRKAPEQSSKLGAWCRFYLDKVQKVLDYIIGATSPLPIIDYGGRIKRDVWRSKFKTIYNKKREERGYGINQQGEAEAYKLIKDFVDYSPVYVSSEDFSETVGKVVDNVKDGAKKISKGAKKAYGYSTNSLKATWKIVAINQTFKELQITVKFLLNNSKQDDSQIRRIIIDHLEHWEDAMNSLDNNDPHEKRIINKLKKNIKKMKETASKLEKPSAESFDFSSDEDIDPTPIVEEMVENGEETEEKEEAVKALEEHILSKLKESGAISDDEAVGENGLTDRLSALLRRSPFKNNDEIDIAIDDLVRRIDEATNIKLKVRLQEMKAALKMKLESSKLKNFREINMKWKKDVPYLVFHKGKTSFGKMISLFTFCPFSHVDIVINGNVYTANENGIVKTKLLSWNEIVIYELNKDVVSTEKILKFFEKTVGLPYGHKRLAKAQIAKLPTKAEKETLDSFFCSHWVSLALDKATNIDLTFRGKDIKSLGYDYFSPKLLFNLLMNTPKLAVSLDSLTTTAEKVKDPYGHHQRSER